jgi:hypothetical protein
MEQSVNSEIVDSKIRIKAISSLEALCKIERELDEFIVSHTNNPFMLIPFLKVKMCSALAQGLRPIVLVAKADGKIVGVVTFALKRSHGIVPFLVRSQIGTYSAKLIYDYYFSPDFILSDGYREECVNEILDFLFNVLDCHNARTYLPTDSPNLHFLKVQCQNKEIYLRIISDPSVACCFLPVDCTWETFEKLRGQKFREFSRRMERNLNHAGTPRISFYKNEAATKSVFQTMLDIEKSSWKQTFRAQNEISQDQTLMDVWEAASIAYQKYGDFNLLVWLLELNGKYVAYTMGCQYKGTAYMVKSSYDEKMKKLSLGIYINEHAISDLFRSKEVKTINFMTNLPFASRWTDKYEQRAMALMLRGNVPRILEYAGRLRAIQFMILFLQGEKRIKKE